jgi:SRSO17 transposase
MAWIVPGSAVGHRGLTTDEVAQIRAALAAGVAPGVVLIDASYGTNTAFRTGIGALGLTYVAAIMSTVKVQSA